MSDELKTSADLLKKLLGMAASGGGAGDETKTTLGKAIEEVTTAVAATGGDAAKVQTVAKEMAPKIEAILKAIEDGKAETDSITFKVAKSDGDGAGNDNLEKAAKILKAMQAGLAKEDAACKACGWKGTTDMLKNGACPECGAKIAAAGGDEKKGFEKAVSDFQADLEKAKAKGKTLTDDEKAKLQERLGQLNGTDKGKDDAGLKKAGEDLEAITKGFGGGGDEAWDYDMAEAGDDD